MRLTAFFPGQPAER